jgi:hypothetical protein
MSALTVLTVGTPMRLRRLGRARQFGSKSQSQIIPNLAKSSQARPRKIKENPWISFTESSLFNGLRRPPRPFCLLLATSCVLVTIPMYNPARHRPGLWRALVARGRSVVVVMAKLTIAQDSVLRKQLFQKIGIPWNLAPQQHRPISAGPLETDRDACPSECRAGAPLFTFNRSRARTYARNQPCL